MSIKFIIERIPLEEYYPRTCDIILWRPLRLFEYTICSCIRQPWHHVSMLVVGGEFKLPYILEQNIDLASETPKPLRDLLEKGYYFDIFRANLTKKQRQRIRRSFVNITKYQYSYRDAINTWSGRRLPKGWILDKVSFLPGGELLITYSDTQSPLYSYKIVNRLTCVAAVVAAFCLNNINLLSYDKSLDILTCTPGDLYFSKHLKYLGSINNRTEIKIVGSSRRI